MDIDREKLFQELLINFTIEEIGEALTEFEYSTTIKKCIFDDNSIELIILTSHSLRMKIDTIGFYDQDNNLIQFSRGIGKTYQHLVKIDPLESNKIILKFGKSTIVKNESSKKFIFEKIYKTEISI